MCSQSGKTKGATEASEEIKRWGSVFAGSEQKVETVSGEAVTVKCEAYVPYRDCPGDIKPV